MRFVSWNVNGLRSALKKGFLNYLAREGADVVCLQEIKATPEQAPFELDGYRAFWHPAERKGYSGTLVLTRPRPLQMTLGMGQAVHDGEGRLITLEYPDYFLVNVYTPNAKRDLSRLAYRTRQWDADFLAYLKRLEAVKPVIFCGDLNVAHQEIDLANPANNVRNAGFTPQERASFDNLVAAGFIDTFREFTREGGHYTWWSQRKGVREQNIGWRLDYFCISPALRPRLRASLIRPEVMGSDHCPIVMELE